MKIITRYVLKHFFAVFGVALFGFGGIYLVIDFVERIDDIIEKQAAVQHAVLYFLLKLPFILCQGIPMATLLASLIGLGILQRNREIIALRAAGINAWAYAGPMLVAALVLSATTFGLSESLARTFNNRAAQLWQEKIDRSRSRMGWTHENVWYKGEGLLFQARTYNPDQAVFQGVTLYFVDGDFRLKERLDARSVRWTGKEWKAESGLRITFGSHGASQEYFQDLNLPLKETPDDFREAERLPEELNWSDLFRYTRRLAAEGYDATVYVVELHSRIAVALTTLILALLGVSIGLHLGHRGGIAVGMALGLLLTFVYLVIFQVGMSFARSELLPPWFGVWAGNLLFLAFGGALWIRAPQ